MLCPLSSATACDLLPGQVVLSALRGRHLGAEGGRGRGEGRGVQKDPEATASPQENSKRTVGCSTM